MSPLIADTQSDSQRVTDAIVLALSAFDPETLRVTAAEAEATAPGSWLPTMLHDYLDSWCS